MNRVLVIRGGAIGDFILTLPALKALREANPDARIEILGYKHIAALGENRFYAQAVRSIEYNALSSFFARNAELPSDLADYFSGFDLIISYLFDPDLIFTNNLRRCGVEEIIQGPAKIRGQVHAARQLSEPMKELGITVMDFGARLYPSPEDRTAAFEQFLATAVRPIVAIHPGSGSEQKNWALENWIDLGNRLLAAKEFKGSIFVISGEADEDQVAQLQSIWRSERVRFAKNLPLPLLAAVLENCVFAGHDSGISHLAAAAGAEAILLFGPTDPAIWAPTNKNARVIRAPGGHLDRLPVEQVYDAISQALMRIGIST